MHNVQLGIYDSARKSAFSLSGIFGNQQVLKSRSVSGKASTHKTVHESKQDEKRKKKDKYRKKTLHVVV